MTQMKVTETKGLFSDSEIQAVLDYGTALPKQKNRVTPKDDPYFRDCMVAWIDMEKDPAVEWMFKKFTPLFYDFPQITRLEVLQFVTYGVGQYCGWHVDQTKENDHGGDRIVTSILQLSDPSEFDGGNLEILLKDETFPGAGDEEFYTVKPRKGSVIFFAGDVCHRVTQVTRGARRALVCWGLK
jgi:PKHD-type hydroxylase